MRPVAAAPQASYIDIMGQDASVPHYLNFVRALALASSMTSVVVVGCSSGKTAGAKSDGAVAADDSSAAREATADATLDDSIPTFGDVNSGADIHLDEAPFDAPVTDGSDPRTCRCPGEDAASPDLADGDYPECMSYAEAKFNHCFGIPGPQPPPDLPVA
ncbi:MAG: hypothetical protein NVSMB1_00140 [Polyangiales bacterium]